MYVCVCVSSSFTSSHRVTCMSHCVCVHACACMYVCKQTHAAAVGKWNGHYSKWAWYYHAYFIPHHILALSLKTASPTER